MDLNCLFGLSLCHPPPDPNFLLLSEISIQLASVKALGHGLVR